MTTAVAQPEISGVFVVGPSTMAPAAMPPSQQPMQQPSVRKAMNVGAVRSALSTNQAGWWASDHRLESEKFVGWHYVAIRAMALQAAQATISVYDDSADPTGGTAYKMQRAALRKTFGSMAAAVRMKSQAADNEPAAVALPDDHRLVKLLRKPSPRQSGALLRYEQVMQLGLTGSCLIIKVPNRLGQTVERYVVPTAIANPRPPSSDMPNGGFYINPAAASAWATRTAALAYDNQGYVESWGFNRLLGMTFPVEQFIIIRWPHPILKSDGQSPISAAALWTDTAEMVDRSRHSHLKQGPDPSVVVSAGEGVDPTEDELDRAAVKFNQKYGGADKHGKAIFTVNADITELGTTPKDMSYDSGFTQMRDAALAVHGVPPLAAGIVSATGREGLYAPLLQFSLLTIQPMLSIIAEEETIQQSPEFGQGLTVEIEAASVDDPDLTERMLQTDGEFGVRTINEARNVRGLPPTDWGNVPMGKASGQPGTAPGTTDPLTGLETGDNSGQNAANPLTTGGEFGDKNRRQWQNNLKAIRDVLAGFKDGTWSESNAVEMLVMLGMNQDRAQRFIDDAKDGTVDDPENVAALNGSGDASSSNGKSHKHNGNGRHKMNGHAKARGSDDDWMTAAVTLLGGR